MSIEVKESGDTITLNLPVNKQELESTINNLKKQMTRFAEDASKEFNLALEEVMKCLPSNIEMQSISLEAIKNKPKKAKKNLKIKRLMKIK